MRNLSALPEDSVSTALSPPIAKEYTTHAANNHRSIPVLRIARRQCVSTVHAQAFSAELFDLTNKRATNIGKVYVKQDKVRFERGDIKDQDPRPAVIVDRSSHTVVIPNHAYRKSEVDGEVDTPLIPLADVNNARQEFAKVGIESGCRKIGSESVNGRTTIKYEGKSDEGRWSCGVIPKSITL